MFVRTKDPIHNVNVEEANPQFAQLPLEQFEEATAEFSSAQECWMQLLPCQDCNNTDVLQDQDNLTEKDDLEKIDLEMLEQIEQHIKNIVCDLQTNLATEMQVCQTYRYLTQLATDPVTRNALVYLFNHQISDNERFMKVVNSPGQLMMNKLSDNIKPEGTANINCNSNSSYKDSRVIEVDEHMNWSCNPDFSCVVHPAASKS
ncbi:MAG: hypothetical protein SWZ49_15245 [Cyanobacteriota bacterium]|nr:hypothetical protein [Cyanobacteriota bacterium]